MDRKEKQVLKNTIATIKKASFNMVTQVEESARTAESLLHLVKALDLLEKEVMFREKR